MTYIFLGSRFDPERLRGSPRNRFSRIVVQEERGTLGWSNFCAKAPVLTCSLPPFTTFVCDNGGPHRPRTCTRASAGCLWCMFCACFLPRARPLVTIAHLQPRPATTPQNESKGLGSVWVACRARTQTVGCGLDMQGVRGNALGPRYAAATAALCWLHTPPPDHL